MKVWELMAALSKLPAGAEVRGVQSPFEYNTEVNFLDSDEATGDEPFVVIHFVETEDNKATS